MFRRRRRRRNNRLPFLFLFLPFSSSSSSFTPKRHFSTSTDFHTHNGRTEEGEARPYSDRWLTRRSRPAARAMVEVRDVFTQGGPGTRR